MEGKGRGSVRSECESEKFSLGVFGQFVKGPWICISGHEENSV